MASSTNLGLLLSVCVCVFWCSSHQGLGLLINLVEYSSRNRHCLVDMDYSLDSACLEDSLAQPADPAAEPAGSAQTQGDQPQSSGALAALVKVRTRGSGFFEELFGLGCRRLVESC